MKGLNLAYGLVLRRVQAIWFSTTAKHPRPIKRVPCGALITSPFVYHGRQGGRLGSSSQPFFAASMPTSGTTYGPVAMSSSKKVCRVF
jgi:hypothetical protein